MGIAPVLRSRPEVFPVVRAFSFRVAFEVRLAQIEAREFAELLLDSCAIRCGQRRAARVDEASFFPAASGIRTSG